MRRIVRLRLLDITIFVVLIAWIVIALEASKAREQVNLLRADVNGVKELVVGLEGALGIEIKKGG